LAIANPLRGLKSDTDDVTAVLKSVGGPIVLVGHSYAGSVIRNAATLVDNVVPLVFVAASAPDAGESAGQLAGRFPGSTLGDKLNMVDLPNGDVDLYVQQYTFWR
jgi:pimeloyl-ACP methyl ester carboxylesterase